MTLGSSNTTNLRYQELRRGEGFLARAACVVILLVGAAIFYIWSHERVVRMGMELSMLQKERVEVKKENNRLCLERDTLRSLVRIEEIASTDLGMVHPDPASIRAVRKP